MYNVNFFIEKFEAIPDSRWTIYTQDDGHGRHCALGFCSSDCYNNYVGKEYKGIIEVFSPIKSHTYVDKEGVGWNVADVNNGDHPDYKQPTPKARILAALYDIKAAAEAVKQAQEIVNTEVKEPELVNP